jgi:hypothetical protein
VSLDIDGFAVFAAIAAHRDLFADLGPEIDKTARALLVKKLKGKSFALDGLRALRAALGGEALALLLDGLGDSEIVALVTKWDKHNPLAKREDDAWRRRHLNALAAGQAEPAPASKKTAKEPKPPRKAAPPKTGLHYASAGRVRKS